MRFYIPILSFIFLDDKRANVLWIYHTDFNPQYPLPPTLAGDQTWDNTYWYDWLDNVSPIAIFSKNLDYWN